MHDFPNDFQIFECGAYDDSTCQVEALQNPTLICTVADLLEELPQKDDPNGNDYHQA